MAAKTWTPKCLASSAAVDRADLELVAMDLAHVQRCCELIVARNETLVRDTISKALLDSAAIRYRRCFGSGVRARLKKEFVAPLGARALELHNLLREIANKHVAHAINAFELFATVVYVSVDDKGEVSRGGLGSQGHFTVETSLKEIHEIGEFVGSLLEKVDREHARLGKVVEAEFNSLSDEQVRKLPDGFPPVSADTDFWRRRDWPPGTL